MLTYIVHVVGRKTHTKYSCDIWSVYYILIS